MGYTPTRQGCGTMAAMIGFALLLFPFVLLGFAIFMGRVEEPITRIAVERNIEHFLEDASPDELETFVREGTDSALSRFQDRLGLSRLRRSWWHIGG
jgi:hypothetical protein